MCAVVMGIGVVILIFKLVVKGDKKISRQIEEQNERWERERKASISDPAREKKPDPGCP